MPIENRTTHVRKSKNTESAIETRIKNRTQLLGNLTKKRPIYDVEEEVRCWAQLNSTHFVKRYAEGNQPSWPEKKERNNYFGMIGHKCFEIMLQQHQIPYIHNDPTIDWRQQMDYDFRVPHVGKIEVKTVDFPRTHINLIVTCREWHRNDYCFAMKLVDEPPKKVKFFGYASREEVEKFHYAENEQPCLKSPCYCELLEKLHPANEFIRMLKTKTAGLWKK